MKKKIIMISMIALLLNIISCDLFFYKEDNFNSKKRRDKKIEAKIKLWNKLEEDGKYIDINIKYDITVKLTIKDRYKNQKLNEYQETISYGESKEILVSWITEVYYYEEEYYKTEVIHPAEIDLEIIESHGYVEDENGTKQYDIKYYPTDIYYHFPSARPYLIADQYHIIKISNKEQIKDESE